jgi:membrane-associated phospholipid phosphatase
MPFSARDYLRGAAFVAALFVVLLGFAYMSPGARWADASALQGFLGLQRPAVNGLALTVGRLGDAPPVGLFALLLAGIALARGRPRSALFVIVLLGLTSISSQLLKQLLAYPRDLESTGLAFISPAAFPSGHATAAMSLAIALVVVMPPRLRPAAAAVGGLFVLSLSYSIVALGWHFPSDVAGGYLLATGWALVLLAGMVAAAERWPERTGRSRATAATRQAIDRGAEVGLTVVLAAAAAAAAGVALFIVFVRPGDLVGYMQNHTAFFIVAAGLALAALVLLASFASLLQRRTPER